MADWPDIVDNPNYKQRFTWVRDAMTALLPDINSYTHAEVDGWLQICTTFIKDGTLPPGMVGHPPPHPL